MKRFLTALIAAVLVVGLLPFNGQVASASMSQYRVYQNEKPLKEFATEAQAVQYAKSFQYSHVEKITNRQWVWHNLPKFKVYIDGQSDSTLEFPTLNEAKKIASQHINSHVRDLENIGWAYENYAKFQLFQGDKTFDHWQFSSLEDAIKAAKYYSNAHIMNLNTRSWVWDNLSDSMIQSQRNSAKVYQIIKDGTVIEGTDSYSFLKDAIEASYLYSSSEVVNSNNNKIIHSNVLKYEVYIQGKLTKQHSTLDAAVTTAKSLTNAEVKLEDKLLWSSVPYLSVYQGERLINQVHTLNSALVFAQSLANSSIQTADGKLYWSSAKPFIYMGWNGSSSLSTINSHIANTQGLDIDSPTWYYLDNADGKLNDTSNASLVADMRAKGIEIVPLVHNQFDKNMTTQFLANNEAQNLFIRDLMNSLVKINAKGVNLDFENIAAKDRQAFTKFVEKFTAAAHEKKLTVSIDLLRGDVSWNHLTAYDYEAIGKIVDYVMIMAYDQHWSGSETAGPVGSLDWVEDGIIQYLQYGIERNKLILGIPFYVREWKVDDKNNLISNRAVLMKDIPDLITNQNATRVYDEKWKLYKITYKKDGYTHIFWEESTETILERVKLAKKYDLAGVAAWRLGYESGALWEQMLRIKEQ